MKSASAGLPMRSKRSATVLMSQAPRRSSRSQPYTAGTFGHFSIERSTISSIGSSGIAPDTGSSEKGREAPAALRQAIQQDAVGLVALENFPAAVTGEVLVAHLVQFFAQQREREPREQRMAAFQVAPDRERGRLYPVHQQIVHELHVGADAPRDVLVLDGDERRSFHRSVELAQRMPAGEAAVARGAVAERLGLEEIRNQKKPARLENRLHDGQGRRERNVLEALAEQRHVVAAAAFLDRKILEAALEDPRRGARVAGEPLPHRVAEILRRDDAVGAIAAIEQLAQQMPRAAADVEDADLALGLGQLRDQHIVVALLGGGEVAERELQVPVPQAVVQIFYGEELLSQHQAQLPAVHFFHASTG